MLTLLQELGLTNRLGSLRIRGHAYPKENILLWKKEDAGIQLSAEQSEWLHATDDEPEYHELEAHYMYNQLMTIMCLPMKESSLCNLNPLMTHTWWKKIDSNITPNSSDMSNNEREVDQNVKEHEDERVLLASLIANLKLDVDENKRIHK
ncbi:hypothetical protein Tco_1487135 [Tanacetum coccineum]